MTVIPFTYDYLHPDYVKVLQYRGRMLENIQKDAKEDPKSLVILKSFYRDHPIQFIADWGVIFEPRNPEVGLPSKIPFVPFQRQIEWLQFCLDRWYARERGMTIKSRGSGISWSAIALSCTLCLFNRGLSIGFGSRKAEYVDNGSDPKALFFKARMFMRHIPLEFRGDWNEREHARSMHIRFPETESTMNGESGDGIGRGDRTSIYFVDESGFLEHPELAEGSLSDTTNCRLDVSTSPGPNTVFADRIHSLEQHDKEHQVFRFHWHEDPRRDKDWEDKMRTQLAPPVFRREFEMSMDEGGEFFQEQSLLIDGQPLDVPPCIDTVYAVIDSAVKTGQEHDGLGVVYFGMSSYIAMVGDAPPPMPWLVVLDWHVMQLEGAMLEVWLPTVFESLEIFCRQYRVRLGSLGTWIEDKASGSILIQQANNRGWPAQAIDSKLTSMGKSERGIDISGYVHRGQVKFSRHAYEKTMLYKDTSKNHLLSQIIGFMPGRDMIDDDLFDCFCYGVAIGIGNREGY